MSSGFKVIRVRSFFADRSNFPLFSCSVVSFFISLTWFQPLLAGKDPPVLYLLGLVLWFFLREISQERVLASDSFLDSSRQLGPTPRVAPSRIAGGGGQSQSSSASGIFFQGDGQSQTAVNSMTGNGRSGLGPVSGDMNPGVLNSTGNSSGPSVGASSLITDANSALSGPQLRRSTSINNESYMHLPASPMSFSSNNISGSSMMDGSVMQQSLHQEQACNKQGVSSATSEAMAQEPLNSTNTSKKARLDLKKDGIMQQQVLQQLLLRPEPVLQGHQNPQLQAILQQQRLAQLQQQHLMQSLPQMQQAPITVQQQQQQRHHMRQQAVEAVAPVERYVDSVIGSRRLMQYLFHQRHRPAVSCFISTGC